MTILPSTQQFVTHAEFTYSNADFDQFVFVILLSNDVSGITIDGGSFSRVETFEEYSWLIRSSTLADNWHVIDSDVPFSVLVFGLETSTSYGYGYNAAFNCKFINNFVALYHSSTYLNTIATRSLYKSFDLSLSDHAFHLWPHPCICVIYCQSPSLSKLFTLIIKERIRIPCLTIM